MKFFILLFLLGAVCAKPAYNALEDATDLLAYLESTDLEDYLYLAADEVDDEIKTELGKKLKEHLDDILSKIKDAIDHGKTVKEDLLTKYKEIVEKLKGLHIDIGEKAKELLQKIKDRVKDFIRKLLDKLGLKEGESKRFSERESELAKNLKEQFEDVLGKIKEKVENGKFIGSDLLKKILDIKSEMVKAGIDMGEKAKEMMKEIWDNASAFWKKMLEKFGWEDQLKRAVEEPKIIQHLRDVLDKVLEEIDVAIKKGESIKDSLVEKAREVLQKLKDKKAEISKKAQDFFNNIKDRLKDYLRKLVEKLDENDKHKREAKEETELVKKLREELDKVLEKVDYALKKGKEIKEDVLEKLHELKKQFDENNIKLHEKAKEIVERIKSRAKEYLRKILEKFGLIDVKERSLQKRDLFDPMKKMLKTFRDMVEKHYNVDTLRKYLETSLLGRTELGKQILDLLKTAHENTKQIIMDLLDKVIGDKVNDKRSLQEMWEKVKNYFKDFFNVHLKEKFFKFGEFVKEHFGKLVEKGKDAKEKLKILAQQLLEHAKELKKDIAEQAIEFLKPYKEDLGILYDQLLEELKKITKKEE